MNQYKHTESSRETTRDSIWMSSLPFFLKKGNEVEITRHKTLQPIPVPCVAMAKHTSVLPILSVSLCVWSGGSPRCGRSHLHSIPLLWPVGQGDPTRRRAPREYLPRPLPWHRRRRPQVEAPPLFPRTSSTRSRTWWTNGRCRCQSHGSDWTGGGGGGGAYVLYK